jgi:Tol biopolymer transport system component/predicted Ser/Thr protein kinase
MSPVSGQRLGPYEIIAPIGAGGMGEVWRARDTRLDRSVAIKMLPAAVAANAQLRARFEREAKSISQLSHPNICALYDVGDDYLVMELIDGESLADRLSRGPLPIDQALRIGIEIAAALQCAHRSGIVHRDLKPGNIMLSKSGAKLLDFGLAKSAADSSTRLSTTEATQQQPLTEEGMIVGTYYYMSPEQLTGGAADARSDIFALGAVLYEMVAGRRAFEGKTKSSVVASILDREPPPLSEINRQAPPPLARVVALCLAKDPDDRWQSAHDVALELEALRDGEALSATPTLAPRMRWLRAIAVAAMIVAALAAGFLAARRLSPSPREAHLALIPPPGKTIFDFVLSPQGDLAALITFDTKQREALWIYELSTGKSREVENSEPARNPFWSPDGRWIGFLREGSLFKVAASGGAPVLIHDKLDFVLGGSWNDDNTIILALDGDQGVNRISASGGPLTKITNVDARLRETRHMWPSFLPDGKHFLFLADADASEDHALHVGSLDGKEPDKRILPAISNAMYAGGYLLYGKASTLMAQPFDLKRLEVVGEPQIVGSQLADTDFHHYVFSASGAGALGFGTLDPRSRLHLVDRTGKETAVYGDPADWVSVSWSPNGRYAALERVEGDRRTGKLWLADLTRQRFNEFTTDDLSCGGIWSPDSKRLLYQASVSVHEIGTFIRGVDGGDLTKVALSAANYVSGWIGDWLVGEFAAKTNPADVIAVSISTGKRVPVATTAAWENDGAFSPDGRWIALNANGRIIVSPFPPSGVESVVSSTPGSHPRWRGDGRELYYGTEKGVMAVPIDVKGSSIEAGTPQLLFPAILKEFKNRPNYDVSPDGQHFLLNMQDSYERPAHVIINWTAALH